MSAIKFEIDWFSAFLRKQKLIDNILWIGCFLEIIYEPRPLAKMAF